MLKSIFLLCAICASTFAYPGFIQPTDEEDKYLTVTELITKYGYPAEEHFVTTLDGYILKMHRIPHGRTTNKKNKIVFLMHGLLSSSADWITTGPDKALGYILADEGYDVWMGNARGNHQSRNHTYLDPNHSEFWQFSWHEIGSIDVPAMIDYVLETTNQTQLYHIGHSQGTTTFYVMTSMHPEYNEKVKAHISLAPVAYMNHMTSPLLHFIAYFTGSLDLLSSLIGFNEFLPTTDLLAQFTDVFCSDGDITQILCSNSLFIIAGFSPKEMNASMIPILAGHSPAGASMKQVMHYGQEVKSGAFRQYDFGLGNWGRYGSLWPPNYDLNKITTPIYMIYSHNDWLAAETDVFRLCDDLGSTCRGRFLVSDDEFNHLDFLLGIKAPEIVYDRIIGLLANH